MMIIFFGSSNYCLPILDSLSKNFQLNAIVTKQNSAVYEYAQKNNIKAFTPKDKEGFLNLRSQISQVIPDLAIVADYGLIIPKEIFDIPKYKTLNIHFSNLPKLRGPSPVQYTILQDGKSAWISVIVMDEKMDTGDVIWRKEISLSGDETAESLYRKLFTIAGEKLPEVIKFYTQGKIKPKKQDHSKATYTKILSRKDGFIPPKLLDDALKGAPSCVKLERTIRAFTPWPGVWTLIYLAPPTKNTPGVARSDSPGVEESDKTSKKRLKILQAHLESVSSLPLRYTSSNTKVVGTEAKSSKKLVLDRVQLEGKKPVSWKQFKEGYPSFSF